MKKAALYPSGGNGRDSACPLLACMPLADCTGTVPTVSPRRTQTQKAHTRVILSAAKNLVFTVLFSWLPEILHCAQNDTLESYLYGYLSKVEKKGASVKSHPSLRGFQGEHQRNHLPFHRVFEAQKAVLALFHVWQAVPGAKRVFVKEIDAQARREQRGE